MLGDKEEHFAGKGTEISALQSHIEDYLKKDGFTIQTTRPRPRNGHPGEEGRLPSRSRRGRPGATVTITGRPNDFTLRFGIGKWLEHLGVAAFETLLLSELFVPIDIADTLWNLEIEDKLIADIKKYVVSHAPRSRVRARLAETDDAVRAVVALETFNFGAVEREIDRGDGVAEVLWFRGPDDGAGDGGVVQDPGEGNLGPRDASLRRGGDAVSTIGRSSSRYSSRRTRRFRSGWCFHPRGASAGPARAGSTG